MTGQRIGYKRVSTVDHNTMRQLEGVQLDEVFEDKASGKSTAQRPSLDAMLKHVSQGRRGPLSQHGPLGSQPR